MFFVIFELFVKSGLFVELGFVELGFVELGFVELVMEGDTGVIVGLLLLLELCPPGSLDMSKSGGPLCFFTPFLEGNGIGVVRALK
jgi:hypothetical protein